MRASDGVGSYSVYFSLQVFYGLYCSFMCKDVLMDTFMVTLYNAPYAVGEVKKEHYSYEEDTIILRDCEAHIRHPRICLLPLAELPYVRPSILLQSRRVVRGSIRRLLSLLRGVAGFLAACENYRIGYPFRACRLHPTGHPFFSTTWTLICSMILAADRLLLLLR